MKVFISWSGERSRKIAELLRHWLPIVNHSIPSPYVSADAIGKGVRWASDLATELEASNFGLLCLTPENLSAPWLHFEAGALSKLGQARVAPILFQLRPDAIQGGPLGQFQATTLDS
jgi:TIR domain